MVITFVILAVTIIAFISDTLRIDIVAMLSLLALVLMGVLTTQDALAGFSNSTVIMIAGLFVVGAGLFQTGVADWFSEKLIDFAGSSETRLLIALMLGAAVLSAFLSNTGTVAVLLPAAVAAARRIRVSPAKLLIPMAFASQVGGLLTLIGTPPNIVVSEALQDAGFEPFSFFEFAWVGIPLLLIGMVYIHFVGKKLLPKKKFKNTSTESSTTAQELAEAYHLQDNLFQVRIRRGSELIGQTLAEAKLGHNFGVTVLRIDQADSESESPLADKHQHLSPRRVLHNIKETLQNSEHVPEQMPGPNTIINVDDVLIIKGTHRAVQRLARQLQLGIQPIESTEEAQEELLNQEIGLAEVVITPRSVLIGQTLIGSNFGKKYNVRVLELVRRGRVRDIIIGDAKLSFGDTLIVRGTWESINILQKERRNFVVVGRPMAMLKNEGLGIKAYIALAALAGMVLMLLTGVVSTVIAVIITGMVMVLGGCLNAEQVYRAISWESVVLIAAMLPMSTALQQTGGAEFIADGFLNTLGTMGPIALLIGMFLLTTSLTQVISNTATTVLVAPIAIETATSLNISPYAMMMMVAVGASTAFLTPIASPVNTLVLTPGGYRFSDFSKVGFPLLIIIMVVSAVLVPLIWN